MLPLLLGEGWGEGRSYVAERPVYFSFAAQALTLTLSQRERE
jgi:hypothetical protein